MRHVVGDRLFSTKKALKEHVRSIMYGPPGEVRGDDLNFLLDLFSYHPNPEKRADEAVRVRVVGNMRNRHFEIQRLDGSVEDISYQKPLDGLTGLAYHPRAVKQAMRGAVRDQTEAFRLSQPAHLQHLPVDHEYPQTFDSLVAGFLESEGVGFEDISLVDSCTGRTGGHDLAESWQTKWCRYHRENAELRMLGPILNSRYGNRDPETVNPHGPAPLPIDCLHVEKELRWLHGYPVTPHIGIRR